MRFLCALTQIEEDVIMHRIRLEQLVDSMDLSSAWYQKHFDSQSGCQIVKELIDNKHLRIDELLGRDTDSRDKKHTYQIPGYSE